MNRKNRSTGKAGGFRPLIAAAVVSLLCMPVLLTAAEPQFLFRVRGSRDLDSFRQWCEVASQMKKHGEVQIAISQLSDKAWFMFPEGGSAWHEYTCYVPAPWMFFPHPRIAPHIPAGWVAANRKMLLDKAAIAREYGLGMIFSGKNSEMLPESFFAENPLLRGPRVDHPRRSRREEFSWCVDHPEVREMIEWTVAELVRAVPEIETFSSGTNDAGSGLCWAAALYPGPNGPAHCSHLTAGERVRGLVETVMRGAESGGKEIVFRWGNVNFWQNEEEEIVLRLPENAYIDRRDPSLMGVGTMINANYPFLGIFDPVSVISGMQRWHRGGVDKMSVSFSGMYARGEDTPETVGRLLELVETCMESPAPTPEDQRELLLRLAARWGGENRAPELFEALKDMHEAFQAKNSVSGRYSNFYCGVSMRHLTRPLLLKPEVLTPEEEAYFLPHVFNPRLNEARMDYIDLHGGRMTGTATWNDSGLRRALGMAVSAGNRLMAFEDAPAGQWLRGMGLSLKMWASEVRSIHNFYHAQLIRDEYADILAGEPRIPPKEANWDGHPGYMEWCAIMRDELDNTAELIAMLRDGGLELTLRAEDTKYEDTFLLGPDLIGQLEKKYAITRAHWLDVQDYLWPPHK